MKAQEADRQMPAETSPLTTSSTTMASELTSMGIRSLESRRMATSTMPSARRMDMTEPR
jgi:hypothetical protein